MKLKIFLSLLLLVGSNRSFADGFAMLGKHQELARHAIVEAGDVVRLRPPAGVTWSSEMFQINQKCVKPAGFVQFSIYQGKRAGLLLIDESHTLKLAVLEVAIGEIKLEMQKVLPVNCASLSSSSDLDTRLEDMKRRTDELHRSIEEGLKRRNLETPR